MITALAMICSCHKQDLSAKEQLAQRKLELDAREEAFAERKSVLDDREKALDEREKALQQTEKSLAAKEQATMNAQTNPANAQDPAEMDVEGDTVTQQLSTRIPDPSQAVVETVEKESEILGAQNLPASGGLPTQNQLNADQLQRERQRIMNAAGISPAPQ